MKKKLITSALPYVNNVPHLGNIIGCVLSADVYARFCRARSYETLYVCGNDEYGTATENKAREEGLTPREVCDKYHAIHVQIYRDFNISFNDFGRTSTPEQTDIAQSIFHDLDRNGLISEETEARVYCEKDAIFLADRYVEGVCPHCGYEDARGDQCDQCQKLLDPESLIQPRCKICGSSPVLKETSHLYLRLDLLQEKLAKWALESGEKGRWSRNAIQTTAGWLEKGLLPRPITRDLKWGVPVPKPGYENKVFYVWYDAPIGYISITSKAYPNWRDWWQKPEEVELYQFMAKDNIPFHTVIFPAALLGSGKQWTLLHHINSTEYLNYENTKFSKSRNVGVFGDDVRKTGIDTDLWRFYLLMIRPERNDSVFNWDEFFERINADFIDNIGNLVNRTLVYLYKNFDGWIGPIPDSGEHDAFVGQCRQDWAGVTHALEEVKLRDALRQILAIGNRGNKFFQDMEPWARIKTDPDHAHATVSALAYLVRDLAIALEPYMPKTSERILGFFQLNRQLWSELGLFKGLIRSKILKPEILYQKLDPKQAEKFRKQFSGERANPGVFHLRAAEIIAVSAHPNSDRLYLLTVNAGEPEPRTIVAGLADQYPPESLQNRKIVVLANLKEAEIRGVVSQGMALVCEKRNKLELLDGSPFEIGASLSGAALVDGVIAIDRFKSAPFRVENATVLFDDEPYLIQGKPIKTHGLQNGKVR